MVDAEPFGVTLTQQEVDEFMLAEKVVPGTEPMTWAQPGKGEASPAMWRGPVEIDAARVGELLLFINPALEREWKFILNCRGEQVYRVDVRNKLARHSNPYNRPPGYPAKVTAPVHEHCYAEGYGCDCARPLADLDSSGHAAIFDWFCTRTHVRIEPPYSFPDIPFQMPML